jgi:hypothetical protein
MSMTLIPALERLFIRELIRRGGRDVLNLAAPAERNRKSTGSPHVHLRQIPD